ncbi:MAG: redox-sensing transcriptional repressor Rex [Desulfatiglandales bacterium]|nr:redox-sensing transcriptional repressor Rex [Desulfatiglandales bacterium]
MSNESKIPDATIERISLYSRPLEILLANGTEVISSEKLADLCRVNPAQVRKDLSYFGEFGVRGVGYDVRNLLSEIKKILVSDREWKLAIVGLGDMGMALVEYENFLKRGYRFVAAFDSDPQKAGKKLHCGLIIRPVTNLKRLTKGLGIEVGVITTPASQAQGIADMLVDVGIKAILNFSPTQVRQPEDSLVVNVDFTINLDNLVYRLSKIHGNFFQNLSCV